MNNELSENTKTAKTAAFKYIFSQFFSFAVRNKQKTFHNKED